MEPKLGYIIIHDNTIQKVGDGQPQVPKESRVYDAKNQYVIPGLIDSHNHIDFVSGLTDEQYASHPQFVADYRKQLPRSYLYFGYTTVIDVATSNQNAIHAFNVGIEHPDLFTCGGGVTMANGYPMNYYPLNKRFNEFPNFVYDPNQNIKLPNNIDPSLHTLSAIINRIVNAHAVCVKLFYESGFDADKNLPLLSLATTKEIIRLAHQHNLRVMVHANSYIAQQFVLASGADIFAHGLWIWGPYDNKPGLPLPIQKLLDQIILRHMGYQPTIQVISGINAFLNPNFLNDPQLAKVVPTSLLNWYKTKEGQSSAVELIGSTPRALLQKHLLMRLDQIKRVLNYLQKNHAELLFGTDTPSGPTYANPPGYNGYLEMKNWFDAGVSLPEILRSATIRNAKFFNLEKNYGSVSPGKIANLIVMKNNPLSNISAYDSITSIILHGQVHDRAEFLANKN